MNILSEETSVDTKGIKVKSLYKAITLLDHFDLENPERGIKELAQLTGMLNSSVYNILSTFQVCGIIEKSTTTGKYRLGKKILELSSVMSATDDIKQVVKPLLDALAEETRETVFFGYPAGTDVMYVDASFPRDAHFARSVAGVKAEMYCTSIGKAMLAFMGEELFQQVVDKGFTAYTPYTLTNADALRKDLEETRARGYAIDNMEHEYGIRCVGVPLCNKKGTIFGAISISGPSLRVMDDKLHFFAERLMATAAQITKNLR